PPRGWYGAVEGTWVTGRSAVDHADRLSTGGHVLWHARLGWRTREGWTLFLAVRNAGDRAHIASSAGVLDLARAPATTTIFLPGMGRTFSLGGEWRR
ncbi:MAG: TonB-dependent receptor, partial [Planctomycetes bacterium]|nr:TonB-dependent receptor [Planctomycetota bacterium]